jgi:peptidoglycan hydrolase-like protein with peptidoglycan-binding domain
VNRLLSVLVVLVLVGAAGLAGWWAASVALAPPEDPLEGQAPTEIEYTVAVETIQRELRFNALAEWTTQGGPANRATGTVTSVAIGPGDVIAPGDVLYEVDLRPVIAAEGTTPMFRNLSQRAGGPDVAQLQALLVSLGFLEAEVDGSFGASTRRAVEAWQEALGLDDTGVVGIGNLVFLEGLPRPVVPGERIAAGQRLSGDEEAVRPLPDSPRFWIPLSPEQRSLVPSDVPVVVEHAAGAWDAVVVEVVDAVEGFGIEYVLSAPGGGPVCGDDCPTAVPVQGTIEFDVRVVVIPETSGPGVPVAAIRTGVEGEPFVLLASGEERPVTVVESSGGTAIVDGIEAEDVVLLPATEG